MLAILLIPIAWIALLLVVDGLSSRNDLRRLLGEDYTDDDWKDFQVRSKSRSSSSRR